jgi:sugar lactone lactonase YvrE
MSEVRKRVLTIFSILLLVFVASTARADMLPYRSYAYSTTGWPFYMQSPYVPMDIIGQNLYVKDASGSVSAVKGLNGPSGLHIAPDGFIYVADTGNDRVVKMSDQGYLLEKYGAGTLKAPQGVYVTDDGSVYVADTGNSRVVVFDKTGEVRATMGAPDDPRLGGMMFTPVDLAVDARGYLYVLLKGNNEGLLIMTPDGRFQGFFARNATQLNLGEKIKRFLYTREQIATNSNTVAASITGLYVGRDGFVYTCTGTLKEGQIKKFNVNGVDVLDNLDTRVIVNRHTGIKSSITSLYVDGDGIIFAVDSVNGAVILYDTNGKPLMMFGEKLSGNDKRIGFFSDPAAVSVTADGTLMVLDRAYNGIQVFSPTNLTRTILKAVSLYNDGQYEAAEDSWKSILKANASYYWANLGLGRVAYMRRDWKTAMAEMRLAYNQEYYSDALWKYRADLTQKNAGHLMAGLLILLALHLLLTRVFHFHLFRLIRKGLHSLNEAVAKPLYRAAPWLLRTVKELRYSLKVLRHPIDTYYDATRRGRGSLHTVLILFAAFFAVMIGERALTNFVFDQYGIRGVSLTSALMTYVMPLALWILGNYLVGAITKGQGTLKGIVISTVYALMPLILFTLPLALLSNVLTLAEQSIYWISRAVLYVWTGLLLFIQVKEIHGYEVGETVKNILWILFVAAMVVVAVAAVSGILFQAYNFLNEFFRELLAYA